MTTHYEVGGYKARITGQRFDKTKNDNPVIVLDIMPQIDGGDGQYGRSISWVITEKTIDFVVEKLRRVGFAGASFGDLDKASGKYYDLSGQVIDVYCTHENGYERWDLPRPQQDKPQIATSERQTLTNRLDALYGRKLKATIPAARRPPQDAVRAASPVADLKAEAEAAGGDEIPF